MDLIHNATFNLLDSPSNSAAYPCGIYRVVLAVEQRGFLVTLIQPASEATQKRTGRPRKLDEQLKQKRKKARPPLVGQVLWIDRVDVERLVEDGLLETITVRRRSVHNPSFEDDPRFLRRVEAMAPFLRHDTLAMEIPKANGISSLVAQVVKNSGVSRAFVYRAWAELCRWGFDARSLALGYERCGAPGVRRPCDPPSKGVAGRAKPGRKTTAQIIARVHGLVLEPVQPGMSSEWTRKILAADSQIPTPKPAWPKRYNRITLSAFATSAAEQNGKVVPLLGPEGSYPTKAQVMRVIRSRMSALARIQEKTTTHHFKTAKRGLSSRNWCDVAGPGHTWAIDSTVGDIYLRSSVNREWVIGRPIVYVVVDVWSTAVMGFYVCLTGPSWDTAKVALFNAAADPKLVADQWGYTPSVALNPAPTLPHALLCDRGEYLSAAHKRTAIERLPMTSYTPPYRGDLKGSVEVLHRIAKDAQFLFVPGAVDFRRKELELRKVDPEKSVFTLREYVCYLHEVFTHYNLSANREPRLDAYMRASAVDPSPAGLWRWGHEAGIGFRRLTDPSDLIRDLLPADTGSVNRDAVKLLKCDYTSPEVQALEWTAYARNLGGWEISAHYYPGSMAQIWTPQPNSSELMKLTISDHTKASPGVSVDEWLDAHEFHCTNRSSQDDARSRRALQPVHNMQELNSKAQELTRRALADSKRRVPSMTDARTIEVAAYRGTPTQQPCEELEVTSPVVDDHMQAVLSMLKDDD